MISYQTVHRTPEANKARPTLYPTRGDRSGAENLPENQNDEKANEQYRIKVIQQMKVRIGPLKSSDPTHRDPRARAIASSTGYDDERKDRASNEPAQAAN